MEDAPIFKAKPQLDPFELYDVNSDVEDVQSARMKLAVLRAKDKVQSDEAYDEADHDLREMIHLENKNIMKVTVTPKLDVAEEEKKLFGSIKDTYSKIFQAMIVMLRSPALFPQLPEEANVVNRRSREFEVRLNRSVFESKQQYLVFKASLVKFSVKPKDPRRKIEVSKKLHSVLRCIYLVLQSYLKHLPLSGGQVFPKALFNFTDMCESFANAANSLGLMTECESLREDSQRLVNAAESFKRKFEEAAIPKEPVVKNADKKVKKAIKKAAVPTSKAEMIQKLAKEKFGSPRSTKIHDRRVSKVMQNDAKLAEALDAKMAEAVNAKVAEAVIVTSSKSNDHANSTLMDGESLANDYFTNNSNREQLQIFNNLKSIMEDDRDPAPISNVVDKSIRKTSETVNNSSVTVKRSRSQPHSLDDKNSSRILRPQKSDKQCLKALEIDDEELAEIEDLRHRTKLQELKSMPPAVAHLHPLELVSSIADRVVMKIVQNVCHEAVDPHLIEKLVQAELVITN